MKVLVRLLALTTAVLALTTAYFAHELWLEQSRVSMATPAQVAETTPVAGKTTVDDATPTVVPPPGAPATAGSCPNPDQIAAAQQQLRQHSDPAERQQLVARRRTSLRSVWLPIALSMEMPDTELDPLLDVLAEQGVQLEQQRLQCRADPLCPACDADALEASLRESSRLNLAGYLGPERMQRYEAWRYAATERAYIDELRSKLTGADALGDAQAERFVLELAAQRRQFIEYAAQQGKRVAVSPSGFTVQGVQGDVAPRPFEPSNRELTAQFNEQLRQLAAQRLSSAQLSAFSKMQEERLANARLMEELTR